MREWRVPRSSQFLYQSRGAVVNWKAHQKAVEALNCRSVLSSVELNARMHRCEASEAECVCRLAVGYPCCHCRVYGRTKLG